MVTEVFTNPTSQKRAIDRKKQLYAQGNVDYLVLLMLDDHKKKLDKRVFVGSLRRNEDATVDTNRQGNPGYRFNEYRGDQNINIPPYLPNIAASKLLEPRDPQDLVLSPLRRYRAERDTYRNRGTLVEMRSGYCESSCDSPLEANQD